MTAGDFQANRVVADIGGTNTRFALYDPATADFRWRADYSNRDYADFEQVVAHWLDSIGEARPGVCCMAVAAPPGGDRINMVNMDWSFSCRELAARFGFQQLHCINDFQSNAYALPHLTRKDRQLLHRGRSGQAGKLATVGPGTGLGGAVLVTTPGAATSHASEPGHMGLSAGTELELELFRALLPRYGNIYAELLVSGPGLQRLYQTLAEIRNEAAEPLRPADISARALNNQDSLCVLALDTFCALLGSVCGDFLLANGAYGGLYLAGGILPGMIPYLRGSTFQQRLTEKGAMREHLDAVPVYVITTDHPGLIGAAHAPF